MQRRLLIPALVAIFVAPGLVHADGPYEGTWREGTMSIRVDVQSWGGDCGQRPQSTSVPGGGTFRISQQGDQLTFQLGRQRSTRSCWSDNRAVRRVSSSHQSGTWRIVCRTPPEDSRSETGTYTIQAIGADQLSFRDVSRYDWQLNESRCQATITTTQSFTRVSGGTPTPTPTPTPREPAEPRASCTPGAAARIALRPSTAELAPGAEQCFTARVTDTQGCAVRGARVELSLAEGPGALSGRCYRAAGEGRARVVAQAGGLREEATVTIRSMDLSDLIARRSESGSLGGAEADAEASAETAARVSARTPSEDEGSRWIVAALAVGVALLAIGGAAWALGRRRRSKRRTIGGLPGVVLADDPTPPPVRAPEPSAPPEPAPTPERADPEPPPTAEAGATPAGEDMICPSCRRGYPPGSTRCPHDETGLVPYGEFATQSAGERICPTCGQRYPGSVTFCGEDGTTLEPA